jgi:hypothetical protein
MSQQASTHLIIPEPSEELIGSEPWSIESYADGFMDELFADIDNILHSNGMPSQTIHYSSSTPRSRIEDLQTALYPEYVIPTSKTSQIVLPETSPPIETTSQGRKELSKFVVGTPAATTSVSTKHHKARTAWGKLLSFGATLGVAIAGIIFLLNSGLIYRVNSKLIEQSIQKSQLQTQLPTKVEVEADLVQYMLGALAIIDRQEARTSQKSSKSAIASAVIPTQTAFAYVTPTVNPPAKGNLPPVLTANNTTPTQAPRTTIVERIYIPVYQAPQPMRYAPPPIAGVRKILPSVPSHASKSKPVKNALNSVSKAPKPVAVNMVSAAVRTELKPVAVRNAPITLRQPSNPLPVLPVTAFQATPPKLPAATAPESSTPKEPKAAEKQAYLETVAAPTYILEGLLELGDKSAALFKVDGVTRRIDVGESIGSSGWTLVEVSKGEAVVRRNGEVRSIYTGQNF